MKRFKKITMGLAALAALALGGSAIAGATGATGGDDDGPDQALSGPGAAQAGKAALAATGGGSVTSVERDDEGARGGYEVKVDKAGKIIEVKVATDLSVTGQHADDDQNDRSDGDDETDDDHRDKGDGDGENPND